MAAALTAEVARTAWLEHLAGERRASPRTLEAYGFAAQRYIAFVEQHRAEGRLTVKALAEVTASELRAWLAHLRAGAPSIASWTGASRRPTRPSRWFAGLG